MNSTDAESLARQFHETYERLAPSFGYQTRKESSVPWTDVPEKNKRLMIAVAVEILRQAPAEPVWVALDGDDIHADTEFQAPSGKRLQWNQIDGDLIYFREDFVCTFEDLKEKGYKHRRPSQSWEPFKKERRAE